jgi:Mn-containing catalase
MPTTRSTYHFIASGQQALPIDSMGQLWRGQNVFSSGNLKLNLLHNFFLECGARANKIRVYEMVDDPTARDAGLLAGARRRACRGLRTSA